MSEYQCVDVGSFPFTLSGGLAFKVNELYLRACKHDAFVRLRTSTSGQLAMSDGTFKAELRFDFEHDYVQSLCLEFTVESTVNKVVYALRRYSENFVGTVRLYAKRVHTDLRLGVIPEPFLMKLLQADIKVGYSVDLGDLPVLLLFNEGDCDIFNRAFIDFFPYAWR